MANQSISVRRCTRAPAPASARRSCGKRPSASAATHSARSSTKSAISLSSRSNPSKRWRGAWLIGLAISVALLAWVLYKIDPRKVWADAQHANGWLLLLTVFVATLTFPVRAIRWRSILREGNGQPFPFMPLWHAMTIGFMANNLLPARAGEFARAYVASRQLPVRFTTARGSTDSLPGWHHRGACGAQESRAIRGCRSVVAGALDHERGCIRDLLSRVRTPYSDRSGAPAAGDHRLRGRGSLDAQFSRCIRSGDAAHPQAVQRGSESRGKLRVDIPPHDIFADHAPGTVVAVAPPP